MINNYLIKGNNKIRDAIKLLDSVNRNCLIVIDEKKKALGTITDGDIRRALLKKKSINSKLKDLCNKNFLFFERNYDIHKIKKIILNENNNINIVPILNEKKNIIKIFTIQSFKKKLFKFNKKLSSIKVVIMAGGRGSRLHPATNVLPKPLMPIGENTLIENIMSKFKRQNLKNFIISINYKKDLIKAYFKDTKKLNLKFLEEKKPLGTAGSLSYLKKLNSKNYFVTNCDNIIDVDYGDIFEYHKQKQNDLTIVGNLKNISIPYGQIMLDENGKFFKLKEKPNIKILINSGLYLIGKKAIEIIPSNIKFDMDQLISLSMKKKLKVDVYPIEDNSWMDVGKWKEYRKFSKSIKI